METVKDFENCDISSDFELTNKKKFSAFQKLLTD